MNKEEELFSKIGNDLSAEKSQMFGKPCFKINGKAFVCLYLNHIVCKMDINAVEDALKLKGSSLFDPSGTKRFMKEWVQIPFKYKDKWPHFTLQAFKYVKLHSK